MPPAVHADTDSGATARPWRGREGSGRACRRRTAGAASAPAVPTRSVGDLDARARSGPCRPASTSRHTRSTSSPKRRASSKPPTASRALASDEQRRASGRTGHAAPGRTVPSTGPRSSERAGPLVGRAGRGGSDGSNRVVMRGATATTVGIVEVGEQAIEPPGLRGAVGVDEGDDVGGRRGASRCCGRPPGPRFTVVPLARARRGAAATAATSDPRWRRRRRRRRPPGRARSSVIGEVGGVGEHGDHHGDVGRGSAGGAAGRHRVGEAGVEQAPGESLARRPTRRPRSPLASASTTAAPAALSRRMRSGAPPTSTVPPSIRRVPGSRRSRHARRQAQPAVIPASTGSTAPGDGAARRAAEPADARRRPRRGRAGGAGGGAGPGRVASTSP